MRLINEQSDAVCFHEINPARMTWSHTPGSVFSMLAEFQAVIAGGPRNQVTVDLIQPFRAAAATERVAESDGHGRDWILLS